jgi:hypothetical protein
MLVVYARSNTYFFVRTGGKSVCPDNPPGTHLVCRVQKRSDDLKAGVGTGRGRSMHVKWIKEQRERAEHEGANSTLFRREDEVWILILHDDFCWR